MFFFFKQKTAYEMLRSLVGSEMCIRDRTRSEKYLDRKLAEISTVHVNHEQTKEEAKSNIIYGTQAFTRYAAVVNN